MNKRGAGIPMHQRVALGRAPSGPSPTGPSPGRPSPAEAPTTGPGGDAPGTSPGRHCWVLTPADGSGDRRPALLVEWRRSDEGGWLGRVVYVVRLRTGGWALLDEWLPQSDLAPP